MNKTYSFYIPFKLDGLNILINMNRTNKYMAAKRKKDIQALIAPHLKDLPEIEEPVEITFHWIEPNRKRDLDNIYSGKKYVLDALVNEGILKNDTQKYVKGLRDEIEINPELPFGAVDVKIEVIVSE